VKTLHRSVTKLQIYPSFNKALLDTFKLKVNVMTDQLKLCCVLLRELAIKENVSCMMRWKILEMLEYFNIFPVVVFILKVLACKWKQPIGYFVTSSTPSAGLLKNLLLKCITIVSEHVALLSKL